MNSESAVNITDLADSLDAQNQQAQSTAQTVADKRQTLISSIRTRQAITDGLESLARVLTAHEPNVVVKNQPKPVTSINVPEIAEVISKLQSLIELESNEDTYSPVVAALDKLQTAVESLPAKIVIPETDKIESVSVDNQIDYGSRFDSLEAAVKGIEVKPQVDLKPNIKVNNDLPELQNVTKAVEDVKQAIQAIKIPIPELDTESITNAVDKVYNAIASLSFPVPNYVLPFKNSAGAASQALVSDDGSIVVGGSLVLKTYDYIASAPTTTTDVYTYKSGGSSGTVVATVTITYTDSTKATIISIQRS